MGVKRDAIPKPTPHILPNVETISPRLRILVLNLHAGEFKISKHTVEYSSVIS